jgi:hypothetical protein
MADQRLLAIQPFIEASIAGSLVIRSPYVTTREGHGNVKKRIRRNAATSYIFDTPFDKKIGNIGLIGNSINYLSIKKLS